VGVASEHSGRDVCPLHGRPGRDAGFDGPAGDQAAAGEVDWAGLPVNLDMVFSQQQRDRVYAQHLMRKRGTQMWLHRGALQCSCDVAAGNGRRSKDAAESMSSR
jgi:hypothetical protein